MKRLICVEDPNRARCNGSRSRSTINERVPDRYARDRLGRSHQCAAARHEQVARFWEDRADAEWADLERCSETLEREAAELLAEHARARSVHREAAVTNREADRADLERRWLEIEEKAAER
jgi:hypothetical protein